MMVFHQKPAEMGSLGFVWFILRLVLACQKLTLAL
jgi:hypothetical protein